jgi:hypothetical protein
MATMVFKRLQCLGILLKGTSYLLMRIPEMLHGDKEELGVVLLQPGPVPLHHLTTLKMLRRQNKEVLGQYQREMKGEILPQLTTSSMK